MNLIHSIVGIHFKIPLIRNSFNKIDNTFCNLLTEGLDLL